MKIGILILSILLFTLNIFAQDISQSNVPAVVLNSFQLKYPNAEYVSWKLEGANYKINYKINSKVHELIITIKGKILSHSQDLYISEIPKAVLEAIGTKVPFFDLHDSDLYEIGDSLFYQIRFKHDGKNHFFWINEKGKLLKYRKELNNSEIPSEILSLIKNKYGKIDIDQAKYVEDNEQIFYVIRGEINDSDHVFTISQNGNILEHTQDLKKSEIPSSVKNALSKNYKGYDIRYADLKEENGIIFYILRMQKSKEKFYLKFNSKGELLKKE